MLSLYRAALPQKVMLLTKLNGTKQANVIVVRIGKQSKLCYYINCLELQQMQNTSVICHCDGKHTFEAGIMSGLCMFVQLARDEYYEWMIISKRGCIRHSQVLGTRLLTG